MQSFVLKSLRSKTTAPACSKLAHHCNISLTSGVYVTFKPTTYALQHDTSNTGIIYYCATPIASYIVHLEYGTLFKIILYIPTIH